MSAAEAIERTLTDALAKEDGVRWAYLFGSVVRGGPFRDVDVAVMPAAERFTKLTELGGLQRRLSHAAGHEIDLVDLRGAPLMLVKAMLTHRRVLLDRARNERCQWEAETLVRALDFEPVLTRYQALREKRLRQQVSARSVEKG